MRAPSILVLFLCAACGGGEEQAPRPNVILITLDTTRADALSSYGFPTPDWTPQLDKLAAEGARFSNAHATSAVTPVSHASILTGQFQYHHRLRVLSAASGFRLPEDQPTLATVLAEAGYDTGAVHSAFPVSGYFGFDRDFEHFDSFDGALEWKGDSTEKTGWSEHLQRRSDETVNLVLAALDEGRDRAQPVFMWIHLWDPHDPNLKPPREYWSHLEAQLAQGVAANSTIYEQFYAAEVRFMDSQIGVLMDGLRERGMLDNTLLAVTADHGEGLSDGYQRHGWGKHRMTYQEQLHVPLILSGPGVSPRTIPDMVSTVDIVPTLLDLLGMPHEGYGGRSLRPLLEGGTLAPVTAYADQVNGYDWNASMVGPRPDAAFLHTVCDGEWKLIYRPHLHEATELFNLVQDPGEEHNVLAQHEDVYLRLMADLAARNPWVLADFAISGEGDPGAQAALAGLGYGGGEEGEEPDAPVRNLEWWWTCPAHEGYRRETREGPDGSDAHGIEGCAQPVVPRTLWPGQ